MDQEIELENIELDNKATTSGSIDGAAQIFPNYIPTAFKCLSQTSIPRYWCLNIVTSPWFEKVTMLIILINCITMGMDEPCLDANCATKKCLVLKYIDDAIFVYFVTEMCLKIVAMGLIGKQTYLAEGWNILDFCIVLLG